jgi:hypothetical protein
MGHCKSEDHDLPACGATQGGEPGISDVTEPQGDRLPIDVLSPGQDLIASFASLVEAYRYAALIYDPPFVPKFRRGRHGPTVDFRPHAAIEDLKDRLNA